MGIFVKYVCYNIPSTENVECDSPLLDQAMFLGLRGECSYY